MGRQIGLNLGSNSIGFLVVFKQHEVKDEFHDEDARALMERWNSPMWDWKCKLCVYSSVCSGTKRINRAV